MDEARPVGRPSPGEVGFKCWPGRSLGRAFARFWPKCWSYGHTTPRRTRRPSGAAARSRGSVRLNQDEHRTSNIEHRILNEEKVGERPAVCTTGEKNLGRWLSRRWVPGLAPSAIEQ